MVRKIILATAAAALAVAPLAAQAAPVRVSSPVAETEQMSQGLMLVLGAAFFALLLILVVDNGGDPTSP